MRRGHARAAVFLVIHGIPVCRRSSRRRSGAPSVPGRSLALWSRIAALTGDDLLSRSDHVGLEAAVTRRALGREVGHAIDMRHVTVCRPDRNGECRVSGIVDGQVLPGGSHLAAQRLIEAVAGVPGRHHHDHARPHEAIDFDAQRALPAREPLGLEVVTDAHVDAVHPDPATVSVELLDVLQGGDQIAGKSLAVVIQHLEAEDLALRRHPGNDPDVADRFSLYLAGLIAPPYGCDDRLAILDLVLSRNDPGHVGAVTCDVDAASQLEGLVVARSVAGEIAMAQRRAQLQVLVHHEVLMGAINARIHHCPDDILTERTKCIARGVGLDGADRCCGEPLDLVVQPNSVERSRPAFLSLSRLFASADQRADVLAGQPTEEVLLTVFALAPIDTLRVVASRRLWSSGWRLGRHPLGQGTRDTWKLVDPFPDLFPRAFSTARIFEIHINDDVLDLIGAVHLDPFEKRQSDDGAIERRDDVREEWFFCRIALRQTWAITGRVGFSVIRHDLPLLFDCICLSWSLPCLSALMTVARKAEYS